MFISTEKPAIANLAFFIECQLFWAVYVPFSLSETLHSDDTVVSSLLENFL